MRKGPLIERIPKMSLFIAFRAGDTEDIDWQQSLIRIVIFALIPSRTSHSESELRSLHNTAQCRSQ